MPTTDDPEYFAERWNSHVDELSYLRFTMPDNDSAGEIEEIQDRLREMIDVAAEELK